MIEITQLMRFCNPCFAPLGQIILAFLKQVTGDRPAQVVDSLLFVSQTMGRLVKPIHSIFKRTIQM